MAWDDRAFVLERVSENGMDLQHVTERLRGKYRLQSHLHPMRTMLNPIISLAGMSSFRLSEQQAVEEHPTFGPRLLGTLGDLLDL